MKKENLTTNFEVEKTTPGIRAILFIASFLVLTVGIAFYFLSEKTNVYFFVDHQSATYCGFFGSRVFG